MKLTKTRVGTIAIIALILAGGTYVWIMLPFFPRPFDSNIWITCGDRSCRISMVKDLQQKYKIIGMPRQQLFKLLGKPDGSETGTNATWGMGTTPSTDDNYFAVDFGEDDRVKYVFQEER